MTKIHDITISLGKHLVSPLIRMAEAGVCLACAAVRSGSRDRLSRCVMPRLSATSGPSQLSPQGI